MARMGHRSNHRRRHAANGNEPEFLELGSFTLA